MRNESLSQRMKRIFLNETGQMTVFVALIFQVLFVFFAMVINIGLLVHDKINLQNAVDLGAYYGAQRQAEILNEIAHINYQIRQDNKLLAWRYRVLGTLGRNTSPSGPPAATASSVSFGPNDASNEMPSVCVANNFWREATLQSQDEESYCYQQYDNPNTIVKIPQLSVVAPFVPGVASGAIQIGQLRQNQTVTLKNQGPLNWAFSGQLMMAYKMALTSRKAVIQKLRQNLTTENMIDQAQQPVAQGVLATVKKNLTVANINSFDDSSFGFKNGLASDACKGPNNDGAGTIVEMRTQPVILYTYSEDLGEGFKLGQALQNDLTHLNGQQAAYDPQGLIQYFLNGEPSDSIGNNTIVGLNASSLGFEKNPWCMAYVGVHASTSPRKPFAPFGQPVQLVARAFAQPFGGRIGPWYRSQWPQGSPVSAGGARVDPLTTPRLLNNANEGGETGIQLLPNYSRFPGDTLGARAFAHQAGTRNLIRVSKGRTNPNQLTYMYFVNFNRITKTGDPLAWDNRDGVDQSQVSASVKNVRTAEEIAIAPDLFDVTYYSIDLNYATNYKALNGSGARFGNLGSQFGDPITVAPDLGGRNGLDIEGFNIASQILVANQALDQTLRNTLGYYIWDKAHVLTSWAPNTNSNFAFPNERFAKCPNDAYAKDARYMIPGVCTNGGRVGYSVRIISRDHLLSDKWQIGGEGQAGSIKNPPPLDF